MFCNREKKNDDVFYQYMANFKIAFADNDLNDQADNFVRISVFHNHRNFVNITKTRLYNFDPLKPHFYIVKLGFTGVYIIFLFLLKSIDCGHSLEPPRRGGSNEYPQSIF